MMQGKKLLNMSRESPYKNYGKNDEITPNMIKLESPLGKSS